MFSWYKLEILSVVSVLLGLLFDGFCWVLCIFGVFSWFRLMGIVLLGLVFDGFWIGPWFL